MRHPTAKSFERRRDRAILLLLARLGLRAGDVAQLRLDDIEWETGSLRVSGKSRYEVRLPLPQDVGDAIAAYLADRPSACPSDHVFLRNIAPCRPFRNGDGVSSVVRRLMQRAGVVAPVKGAHVLRHTAATEMLRHGVPLEKIGLVLRHRGVDTTARYAKADVALLKQIAQPWPEVSLMLKAIEAYLALRRATGFAMLNAECLLKSFAAFATERGQTHVHAQTAIDWAARGPSAAQRDARLKAVCRFVRHVRVEDARHELPPVNHFGARKTRRPPHIYSAAEIDRLIEAALRLRPKGGLRPWTYATLIALLSVTGLRISEALKLTVADVTRDGLLIRETKFRKTRLAPLHDTAAAGLERYLARRRPCSEADPVFVDAHGLPLRYIAVKETFDRLVCSAGIAPAARRRPRLHDLRHTFAVRALQGSPADRSRTGAHMAALATYMGHVNIYATYWYLEATADLMRDVAAAGEAFFAEGRQS